MPLIKPRTRGKQLVRRIVRFDRETNETLFAYAHFLGETTDYVLNEVIDTVLAKDKEFLAWRAENRTSFVPPPPANQPVRKRRSKRRADSQPSAPEAASAPSADPDVVRSKAIKDGVTKKVAKGDVIAVPPGTPHWFNAIEGTITYLESRVRVK